MSTIVLITAAGRGSRFTANHEIPKQYMPLAGMPILRHSIKTFTTHPDVDNVLVVIHPDDIELYNEAVAGFEILPPVFGGDRRQDSVRIGIESMRDINPTKILIHDAARPFVGHKIITATIKQLDDSSAVVPAIPLDDTIKKCLDGKVLWTVPRSDLWAAQTPQGFIYKDIFEAHQRNKDLDFTDDAAIFEHNGGQVAIVPGFRNNFKITTDADYERAEYIVSKELEFMAKETRIGHGFDIHALGHRDDQKHTDPFIVLGGVKIPFHMGLIGHSDADVVLHALTDAILGSMGLGDIGMHFSDHDNRWKNKDSQWFLRSAHSMMKGSNGNIVNIDINIMCEEPKISPYRDQIKHNIAQILALDPSKVNIKAKTYEGLGPIGQKQAIAADASISVCITVPQN